MSADSLVFDMSSMAEGTPSVFVRKDWVSILDNQNQNYQGNQSTLDTSQLANSNKYFNYREAYLTIPLVLTLTQAVPATAAITPGTATTSLDYVMGLKNWYGSIIHSLTVDYNGTTIVQQTPYTGLWNTFKLMTSLSYQDVVTNGSAMGFWPDNATSWEVTAANSAGAIGSAVSNNRNSGAFPKVANDFTQFDSYNEGLLRRQQGWNFDPLAVTTGQGTGGILYGGLLSATNMNLLWKSYIFNRKGAVVPAAGPPVVAGEGGCLQIAVTAQVMLKHMHSFFERVPLLKGVFLKLTCNLNQVSTSFTVAGNVFTACSVTSPLGGVNPMMIASAGAAVAEASGPSQAPQGSVDLVDGDYIMSVSVGRTCLNSTQTSITAVGISTSPLGGSVLLNIPAYTFNPTFETSYLSSPIKKIVYSDIYQYQVINQINANGTFNQLITNGIANIKSVLVLPFFQQAANGGLSPIQSPFEGAGAGPTSPLCLLTQFNVQISGQNAIYNTVRYSYEEFMNQLQGCNSINGNLTDGLTSGLVDQKSFEMCYNYYYVNCGRMLPVEEAVPKSVNILGTNMSARGIDLFVFIEYGVEVSVDVLTGARV
jgi:hypothetical protein